MDRVKKKYKTAYATYGKAKESLFIPKGRQNERFELLTNHIRNDNFSLLDFGCGFGDLKLYLLAKYKNFNYLGVDMVSEFIDENRKIDDDFQLINSVYDIKQTFDYICISGAFNMSYVENDLLAHKEKVQIILEELFHNKLNKKGVLSVDFMHDGVDFMQENAFHVDIIKMYEFFIKKLSKRVIINKSLFPYEVTFTIFKDISISEDNLYE